MVSKYEQFIEKVIQQTKERELNWQYLDDEESLYTGMNWITSKERLSFLGAREDVFPDFDRENSFCVNKQGMNIVLLVTGSLPATLYIVPDTFKKAVKLSAGEYGESITRLLNLVQSQFPDAEKFIDLFVSDDN